MVFRNYVIEAIRSSVGEALGSVGISVSEASDKEATKIENVVNWPFSPELCM